MILGASLRGGLIIGTTFERDEHPFVSALHVVARNDQTVVLSAMRSRIGDEIRKKWTVIAVRLGHVFSIEEMLSSGETVDFHRHSRFAAALRL